MQVIVLSLIVPGCGGLLFASFFQPQRWDLTVLPLYEDKVREYVKEGFVPLVPHRESHAAFPCLYSNFLITPCLRQIFGGGGGGGIQKNLN